MVTDEPRAAVGVVLSGWLPRLSGWCFMFVGVEEFVGASGVVMRGGALRVGFTWRRAMARRACWVSARELGLTECSTHELGLAGCFRCLVETGQCWAGAPSSD